MRRKHQRFIFAGEGTRNGNNWYTGGYNMPHSVKFGLAFPCERAEQMGSDTNRDALRFRILLTVHHELDSKWGAPGATIALAHELGAARCQVSQIGHNHLPKWASGWLSIIAFPLLVAWRALKDRQRWDVLDFASYDGWVATMLPRRLRPRVLAFHSHGLEHIIHERLIEQVKAGNEQISWRYGLYRGSAHLHLVATAARRADVAFFLNEDERAFAIRRLGVDPSRALIASNGLDKEFLDKAMAARFIQPNDKALNVAFVGTYIQRKGIAYLMPALAKYLADHSAAQATLLGTSVDRGRVMCDLPNAVHDRVTVVPRYVRSDLPELLAGYHVFVLPSLAEGFSLAGLEAMASGLVPILTRGHGFEEYTTDGVNGILIDRGNAEQISAALEQLNDHRAMWQRLRDEAVRTARSFTWERAAAIQLAGYQKAFTMQS